jgi:hypothetical protein
MLQRGGETCHLLMLFSANHRLRRLSPQMGAAPRSALSANALRTFGSAKHCRMTLLPWPLPPQWRLKPSAVAH